MDTDGRPRRLVHLVDDDLAVRRSQTVLLKSLGYHVQAWVDGDTFLKAVSFLGPSCILLDLSMPHSDGLTVQSELTRRGIDWPVIFLSGTADIPQAVAAVRNGAVHFLVKPAPPNELVKVLNRGFEQLANSRTRSAGATQAKCRLARLTTRETEVLEGLVEGLPNKSIAYDLGVSPRTIEAHRAKIMRKLEATSFASVLQTVFEARQ
ncbi:response regulator transcription factor [Qipengyuania sp. MTN3-11]